jgi:hypothetical protein
VPAAEPFKTCTMCHAVWDDLRAFVLDPELYVMGYLAVPEGPGNGLILTNHRAPGCGTTLGVHAHSLRVLYAGPEHPERRMGTASCSGYCLTRDRLDDCDADCDLAWVRHAMQYLRRHELPPHLAGPPAAS